jgi:hypothetical protein
MEFKSPALRSNQQINWQVHGWASIPKPIQQNSVPPISRLADPDIFEPNEMLVFGKLSTLLYELPPSLYCVVWQKAPFGTGE